MDNNQQNAVGGIGIDYLQRRAQQCPICFGKGIVPNGFYNSTNYLGTTSSLMPETCRGCGGKGWIIV